MGYFHITGNNESKTITMLKSGKKRAKREHDIKVRELRRRHIREKKFVPGAIVQFKNPKKVIDYSANEDFDYDYEFQTSFSTEYSHGVFSWDLIATKRPSHIEKKLQETSLCRKDKVYRIKYAEIVNDNKIMITLEGFKTGNSISSEHLSIISKKPRRKLS